MAEQPPVPKGFKTKASKARFIIMEQHVRCTLFKSNKQNGVNFTFFGKIKNIVSNMTSHKIQRL